MNLKNFPFTKIELSREITWLKLSTVALLRIAYNPFGSTGIGRFMGFCLLAAYLAYQTMLLTGGG